MTIADALRRIARSRPIWTGIREASVALQLPNGTLLHAGPPLANARAPSAAVLSSAVMCCLYEGWAESEAQAEMLIAQGDVTLASAQSYDAVVPLAAIISPRTPLVEVTDAHTGRRSWSMLSSGAGAQIRFGCRDPKILERLHWRDAVLAPALRAALTDAPIDLIAIAEAGLRDGDDLHARTTAATRKLCDTLKPKLDDPAVRAMLDQSPLFFLTLWMAACHLALSAAISEDTSESTLVVALSGNGQQVGIRLAGAPGIWFTAPASPPLGPYLDPVRNGTIAAAGMTGDSGVIDAAGFGARMLDTSPEPLAALAPFLPTNWSTAQNDLFAKTAPTLSFCRSAGVLDAARVRQAGADPLAVIAMIGADGATGLLGRGAYTAPCTVFASAVEAVAKTATQIATQPARQITPAQGT